MKISLRAGERIYINGAVLRVDRKVSLELVNDVMFLLEGQVMQASDATTALRQLYFIVQLMLMNPTDIGDASRSTGSITRPCSRCARAERCWTGWRDRRAGRDDPLLRGAQADPGTVPGGAGHPGRRRCTESPFEAA